MDDEVGLVMTEETRDRILEVLGEVRERIDNLTANEYTSREKSQSLING